MSEEANILPDKGKLISGIMKDAQEEATRIVSEARAEAAQKIENARKQAEAIIRDAEAKAEAQCESIRRITNQNIAVETRRLSLRAREQAMSAILSRVKERIESLIGEPTYRKILVGWIAEAAMGLSAPEALVSTSAKELPCIDADLLKEAEETVKSISGRTVRLTRDESVIRDAQGVVLTAVDGKTAFNNQVPTRLLRYQSEIRKVLYSELFKD